MAEYHVGCGVFGIYAGTLNKNKNMWLHKSDVTNECLDCAAQYLLEQEKSMLFTYNGKRYALKVEEIGDEGD